MQPPESTRQRNRFVVWNDRLHLYLGLFLLGFLWLFAASGLLLNHGWAFTEFWNQRRQATFERSIVRPGAGTDLDQARQVMAQLEISGEIEWTNLRPKPDELDFRVVHPGRILDVRAELGKGVASVHEIRLNGWGVIRMLHTFSGVRSGATERARNWWLTKLWSFAMDAVSVGLVLLVVSSLVMASQRRDRRWAGALALALGLVVAVFFAFGLRLL